MLIIQLPNHSSPPLNFGPVANTVVFFKVISGIFPSKSAPDIAPKYNSQSVYINISHHNFPHPTFYLNTYHLDNSSKISIKSLIDFWSRGIETDHLFFDNPMRFSITIIMVIFSLILVIYFDTNINTIH